MEGLIFEKKVPKIKNDVNNYFMVLTQGRVSDNVNKVYIPKYFYQLVFFTADFEENEVVTVDDDYFHDLLEHYKISKASLSLKKLAPLKQFLD